MAVTILFFTVRIGVATATVGNVRVMNARLRREKRHQSQQPADTSHDDLKKKYQQVTDTLPTLDRQGFLGALLHNYH